MPLAELHAEPVGFTAMSFNVRNDGLDHGDRAWPLRRAAVAAVIASEAPDVVGLQEPSLRQVMDLLADLPDYAAAGAGARDGAGEGQLAAILYRRDRLVVAEAGTRWLSPTPTQPSRGWKTLEFRTVAWARLLDVNGAQLLVLNTHWDHESADDRVHSGSALGALVDASDVPVVVLGDLNAEPNALEVAAMLWPPGSAEPRLIDTLALQPGGTFHGWTGEPRRRIDYVLVRGMRLRDARVVRAAGSDHFPCYGGPSMIS